MSEIKGQLLGLLMVMLLFTTITVSLYSTFTGTSERIGTKAAEELSFVDDPA